MKNAWSLHTIVAFSDRRIAAGRSDRIFQLIGAD